MEVNPFLETMVRQTRNDPEAIAADNHAQARFFWGVKNVQITHFKDSHNEFTDYGSAIEVKTITETTQYATITYERDTRMPYYEEVKDLERRYWEASKEVTSLREDLLNLSSKAIDRENPFTINTVFLAVKYGVLLLIAYGFFSMPKTSLFKELGPGAYMCWIYALIVLAVGIRHFLRKQKEFERTKKQLYSDALPRLNQLDHQVDEMYSLVAREL